MLLAGPLASLGLAGLIAAIAPSSLSPIPASLKLFAISFNGAVALLNILPAPRNDGASILQTALLPFTRNMLSAVRVTGVVGCVIAVALAAFAMWPGGPLAMLAPSSESVWRRTALLFAGGLLIANAFVVARPERGAPVSVSE